MVRREGSRVRCFTRGGYDWAARFPAIVQAASRIKAQSFLIDGEVVVCRDDGLSDFKALHSRRRDHDAVLFAFDPIEHHGDELRNAPLLDRKRQLAKLLGKAKHAICFGGKDTAIIAVPGSRRRVFVGAGKLNPDATFLPPDDVARIDFFLG
jgi:bifunctional non-homologous end joining protein LigD